jgi:hypothetical protein
MMAGSASAITDFDGWMLRYMWTKIKDESGRFDIPEVVETTTEESTEASTEATSGESERVIGYQSFTDTITECGDGYVEFSLYGRFTYLSDYYDDPTRNLAYYEKGDRVIISFNYYEDTGEIIYIDELTLVKEYLLCDVNNDGIINLLDIVALQRYLLNIGTLENWNAADIYADGQVDAFDLAALKCILLTEN